ncbi:MAG: COQ9 family protein [Hyphomonadaceae bacterium]|nr:COQ9 family protein [Hyphomonadaceae bacterium]
MTPSERYRAQLLEAFPPRAAAEGWTRQAFLAAAADAGLSEGAALLACPKAELDLADASADRADAAMLARLSSLALSDMKVRARVKAAVLARLEAQAPHKDAARAMARMLARRPGEAVRLLWRTADRIWRALGDPSTDGNFYSKRAILSGVLGATYAYWHADDTPDCAPTRAFLDARIDNVMQFERLKGALKPLGGLAEGAVGFAARMRYGGR